MFTGKRVINNTYLHVECLRYLQSREAVELAAEITGTTPGTDFSVIKLSEDLSQISLLDYPEFFSEAFPTLKRYWTVNINNRSYNFRTYEGSLNPPILHRKELLLPIDHNLQPVLKNLTANAEQIGLFDEPRKIGFLLYWERLLKQKGYKVISHDLIPIGNEEIFEDTEYPSFSTIERHRTALSRTDFSAPLQTLAKHGFLDGNRTIFDYGCGKGDDVRGLLQNSVIASGWDPYYAPTNPKQHARVVNIGFVINVIECLDERVQALEGAYELTEEVLAVSAMLANENEIRGKRYGDGFLTSRNTFQKYYSQAELKKFISETLNTDAIPVAPGVFFVFKDKESEQRFLLSRVENRRRLTRLPYRSRPPRADRKSRAQQVYEANQHVLDGFWSALIKLGRLPDISEISSPEDVINVAGSLKGALKLLRQVRPETDALMEQSQRIRTDDLKVFFSIQHFEKHKLYKQLDPTIQRDIKAFFFDYQSALTAGKQLLLNLGDAIAINEACQISSQYGIGWLEESESLQIHISLVPQLPALLRTYISCGSFLYGDISDGDIIKIHIRSGKLTLMYFDDFEGKALPRMIRRVKINLRTQDFQTFDYTDQYTPPYLYNKSRFINEEYPKYIDQISFEEEMVKLVPLDISGYGPSPNEFDEFLISKRISIDGYSISRAKNIPALDTPCGDYFTYRHFIECGETQEKTKIQNLPNNPDSYSAILDLAVNIIDPVVEYFGMIDLTYGFCSQELSSHIKGRIGPKLDQHSAHECNRLGKPICERLGAAVDFIVCDEDMLEVAQWIVSNLPFDRLYFYGNDRPIHVSYSKDKTGQVTVMAPSKLSNRKIPKTMDAKKFLDYGK